MKTVSLLKGACAAAPLGFLLLSGCGGQSGSEASNATPSPTLAPTATKAPVKIPSKTATPRATPKAIKTPVPTPTPSKPHTANLQFGSRVALSRPGTLSLLMNPSMSDDSRALNVAFYGAQKVGATQTTSGTLTAAQANASGVSYFEKTMGWKAVSGSIKITKLAKGRVGKGSPGQLALQFHNVKMVPVASTGATGTFTINQTYTATNGDL